MSGRGAEEDYANEKVGGLSCDDVPDEPDQGQPGRICSLQHLSAANQRRETIPGLGGNMRTKKALRGSVNHNGANLDKSILSDRHIKNKIRKAFYHGSVAGGFLAFLGGACYIETSILEGLFIAVTGLAWMLVFYLRNPEDELYG